MSFRVVNVEDKCTVKGNTTCRVDKRQFFAYAQADIPTKGNGYSEPPEGEGAGCENASSMASFLSPFDQEFRKQFKHVRTSWNGNNVRGIWGS